MPGTLFVVATPIGNLEDLTFRALRVLKECDLIAAEDTRRTSKLLAHYEIRKSLVSLREHNEVKEIPRLLGRLSAGQAIALVSDAGTPTIADPGVRLVKAAREAGYKVVPIPGANAIATALSASGVVADQFVFMGFPPATGLARERWFQALATEHRTVVFYETPHRIGETISSIGSLLVKRPIVLCREITKINEEFVVLPISGDVVDIRSTGEFTVIIDTEDRDSTRSSDYSSEAPKLFGLITENSAIDESLASELVCLKFGISKVTLKNLVKRARISAKQHKSSLS